MNPRKGTVTLSPCFRSYFQARKSDEHESSEGDCDSLEEIGWQCHAGSSDEHESSEGDCDLLTAGAASGILLGVR